MSAFYVALSDKDEVVTNTRALSTFMKEAEVVCLEDIRHSLGLSHELARRCLDYWMNRDCIQRIYPVPSDLELDSDRKKGAPAFFRWLCDGDWDCLYQRKLN